MPNAGAAAHARPTRVGNDRIRVQSNYTTLEGRPAVPFVYLPLSCRPNVCGRNQCGALTGWNHFYLRFRLQMYTQPAPWRLSRLKPGEARA